MRRAFAVFLIGVIAFQVACLAINLHEHNSFWIYNLVFAAGTGGWYLAVNGGTPNDR